MNFLLEYGIKKETIEKIKEIKDDSEVFYCLTQKDNVTKVINYLRSINVKNIDDILLNRLELFYVSVNKIKESFEKYNINVLVQLLNEDINILNNV